MTRSPPSSIAPEADRSRKLETIRIIWSKEPQAHDRFPLSASEARQVDQNLRLLRGGVESGRRGAEARIVRLGTANDCDAAHFASTSFCCWTTGLRTPYG